MRPEVSFLEYMYREQAVLSDAEYDTFRYQTALIRRQRNDFGGFDVLERPLGAEETDEGYVHTVKKHFDRLIEAKSLGLLVKHNGNGRFAEGIKRELGLMKEVRERHIDPLFDLWQKILRDSDHRKVYLFESGDGVRAEVRHMFIEGEEQSEALYHGGEIFNFFRIQRGQFLFRDYIHIQHYTPENILGRLQGKIQAYYNKLGLVKWVIGDSNKDALLNYVVADSQQEERDQILPRVVENPSIILTTSPIEGIRRLTLEKEDLKKEEIELLRKLKRERSICGHTLLKMGIDKEKLGGHYRAVFGQDITVPIEYRPVFYRG